MRLALYASVAAIALVPLAAAAQETRPAGGDAAATGSLGGIEEIIVTAQRRAETVQKSSVPINVLSEEVLARSGVTSTQDLSKVLPGVQVGIAGPIPQIYIRGIGDFGSTAITNPAIALNVGGVYWARPGAVGGSFYDLERVEVLKGPQGTLYGRNASGGAINVLPVKPKLGVLGGAVNLEVGNYSAITADGAINVPIGDQIALRGSFQIAHRDGYLSDGGNDDIHQSVRLQALWQPTERLSVLLFGSYYHAGGKGSGYVLFDPAGNPARTPPRAPTAPFDPWTSVTAPQGTAISASAVPPAVLRLGNSAELYQNNAFWNAQAEITADLGFATLTVIPSYQKARMDYKVFPALSYQTRGLAGTGAPEESDTFSGEVRLSNASAALKWVLGAFYYDEDQRQQSTINNGPIQNTSLQATIRTKSLAFYGQGTYSLTPTLRAVVGLRYTDDKRKLTNGLRYNNNTPAVAPGAFTGSAAVDKVNYRAGIEFDVAERNMLYATVATGFKGGGTQLAIAPAFRPETLQAFELGSRNRFFDNKLQLNLEAFYWKYNDHQEQVIGPDDIGVVGALIRNAGRAKSYGVDADIVFKPTPADTLSGNIEYNRSQYLDFSYTQPLAFIKPGQTTCAVSPTGQIGPVGPVARIDCSGQTLSRAPRWSGGASYTHTFTLRNGGTVDFTGDLKFASARWLTVDFIPNVRASRYQTYNASLTYVAPGEHLTLTAFIRNITNAAVYTGANQSTFAASYVGANINPPRTFGGRLSLRY